MTLKFFEIPALLFCELGNSAENGAGEIQNIYIILNFPTLDFLIHKIKARESQNIFCRSLVFTLFLYVTLLCNFHFKYSFLHRMRKVSKHQQNVSNQQFLSNQNQPNGMTPQKDGKISMSKCEIVKSQVRSIP